ncbi:MAG: fimbrillin family protein [Prevotella sp.]|nr:fimbrillin family protein [Prevotella sp.]
MKTNKLFLGLATIAAAVFSFSSCSQDELSTAKAETPDPGQEILLSTNFSTTRSVAQDIQTGSQIVNGVQVGVFVTATGDTDGFVDNGKNKAYTADGSGGLTAVDTENKVYYPKTGSVDIYAYAPYQSSWDVTDVNADQDFTVQADQSSEDNYKASDLIWATPVTNQASSETALALPFVHKLSKININIVNNRTGLSLKGATVSILNTVRTATINPSTGAVAKKADVDASAIVAATYDSEPTATTESPATASAIIVPQTIAADTKFIQVVTSADNNSGESVTLTAKIGTSGKTFAANKRYNYTLTIKDNSVELTFNGTSLGTWDDENESGDLEDDTPAVTYGIGDYVLSDGTFMKQTAYASATDEDKAKIRAIIFSTAVDSNDSGYDGYAMGVVRMGSKYFLSDGTNHYTTQITAGPSANSEETKKGKSTLANAIALLNGRSLTSTVQSNENYDTYKSSSFFNLGTYTSNNSLSGSNLSGWFVPSFGQMIAIMNNLGSAGITSDCISWTDNSNNAITAESDSDLSNSKSFYSSTSTAAITAINNRLTAIGKTGDLNDKSIATATENGTAMWIIKTNNDGSYELSRSAGKSTGNRSIMPCLAFKLPANE